MRSQLAAGAVVLSMTMPAGVCAGVYDTQILQAAQWLSQSTIQNVDGSWGDTDELKHLATSEVVLALRATNNKNAAYLSGITWLENHDAPNIDYKARRVLALVPHGANLSSEKSFLLDAQNAVIPGNRGWGLTAAYYSAAVDTALTLLALRELGVAGTGYSDAIAYLTSAQLPSGDAGWAQGTESLSEPASTALALLALVALRPQNPSLATPIANAVTALSSRVSTTSTNSIKALGAYALLKENPASTAGTNLVSALVSGQTPQGHWDTDPYTTALAMRALAAAQGVDFNAGTTVVDVPDPNLRAALLQALGKAANAQITRADLASLTTLNLANKGISNLQGLQFATGLTSLDLRGNPISSLDPILGILGSAGVQITLNVIDHDFGGDHRADLLFWNRTTGATAYWFMDGARVIASGAFPNAGDTTWQPVGIGDFNGDGKADVLLRSNVTNQNTIWLVNGSQVTVAPIQSLGDANWRAVGVGDFDGDGKADILWRHVVNGQNMIWFMDGATVASAFALTTVSDTGWKVMGVGDFDGNGKADILWRHSNGSNMVWLQSGATTVQSVSLATIPDANWSVVGVADFNGDKRADILWRNSVTGNNALWVMDGATVAVATPINWQIGTQWKVGSVADFDGDSAADIFWVNTQTGQALVWLMRGAEVLEQTASPGAIDVALQTVGIQVPQDPVDVPPPPPPPPPPPFATVLPIILEILLGD